MLIKENKQRKYFRKIEKNSKVGIRKFLNKYEDRF